MIIVTGGAGFIGSNLVAALEERGLSDIVVCDRLGKDGKWRNIAKRELRDIVRPEDFIVKSTGSNSSLKLYIIQNVDRKLALPDIASAKGLEMPEFIKEMEAIVYSGTKLNIDYWIDEVLDEDQQEEIHEYFLEAKSDKIEMALDEFDGDYDEEELRLYRIKFISEVGN